MQKIKTFLQLIRIKHWIKNTVCFVPLIFSLNFTNPALTFKASLVFLAFCLVSSGIYIFNDISDIKTDRLSATKSKRPLASGKILITGACIAAGFFLLTGFFTSVLINPLCLLISGLYVVLNVLYTIHLKNIEIIDVFCIALGFILRILAGCAAIAVIPSPLVILLTFFVSMFFTFSKRRLEFKDKTFTENENTAETKNTRKSLKDFNCGLLDQFICANAMLSIAFYFAYMMDTTTIERSGTGYLYISAIPFTLIIFRLLYLANTSTDIQDPAEFLYRDNMTKILFLFYLTVLFTIFAV